MVEVYAERCSTVDSVVHNEMEWAVLFVCSHGNPMSTSTGFCLADQAGLISQLAFKLRQVQPSDLRN